MVILKSSVVPLICEWHWCSGSRKLRLGYSDDSAIEIKLRYEDISDHDMEKEARNLQKSGFYAGINVLRL